MTEHKHGITYTHTADFVLYAAISNGFVCVNGQVVAVNGPAYISPGQTYRFESNEPDGSVILVTELKPIEGTR